MKRTSWLVVDLFIPIISAVGIILLFLRFMHVLDLDTKIPLPTDEFASYMLWCARIATMAGLPIAVVDLFRGSTPRGIISIVLIVLTWPLAWFAAGWMAIATA